MNEWPNPPELDCHASLVGPDYWAIFWEWERRDLTAQVGIFP